MDERTRKKERADNSQSLLHFTNPKSNHGHAYLDPLGVPHLRCLLRHRHVLVPARHGRRHQKGAGPHHHHLAHPAARAGRETVIILGGVGGLLVESVRGDGVLLTRRKEVRGERGRSATQG